MNGKKAKSLRRFAERLGGLQGLPAIQYEVVEHARNVYIDGVVRNVKTHQLIMANCVRKMYRFSKAAYKRASW